MNFNALRTAIGLSDLLRCILFTFTLQCGYNLFATSGNPYFAVYTCSFFRHGPPTSRSFDEIFMTRISNMYRENVTEALHL